MYILECDKSNCRKQYIGVTGQELQEIVYQHVGYVRNKVINKATVQHFNLPGHEIHHMKFTAIEQVKSKIPYMEEKEINYSLESSILFSMELTRSHRL